MITTSKKTEDGRPLRILRTDQQQFNEDTGHETPWPDLIRLTSSYWVLRGEYRYHYRGIYRDCIRITLGIPGNYRTIIGACLGFRV